MGRVESERRTPTIVEPTNGRGYEAGSRAGDAGRAGCRAREKGTRDVDWVKMAGKIVARARTRAPARSSRRASTRVDIGARAGDDGFSSNDDAPSPPRHDRSSIADLGPLLFGDGDTFCVVHDGW